ncbi:Peptidase propeptide and YPEB domain protein [compost metagenome]
MSTIGEDKASAIAVSYLKGTVIKVKLDRDDATLLYEVKLKIAKGTAEVKVDALTGKIVSVEKDLDRQEEPKKANDDKDEDKGSADKNKND